MRLFHVIKSRREERSAKAHASLTFLAAILILFLIANLLLRNQSSADREFLKLRTNCQM
jgi:uncharacterized membrane protein YvbJ